MPRAKKDVPYSIEQLHEMYPDIDAGKLHGDFYDESALFDKYIRELLLQIKCVCTKISIPCFWTFAVANEENKTTYHSDGVFVKTSRSDLFKNAINNESIPNDIASLFGELETKGTSPDKYNYHDEYIKYIAPLIQRIKYICTIQDIPCFWSFATENNEKKTVYVSDGVLTGSSNIKLAKDYINKFTLVLAGYLPISRQSNFSNDEDETASDDEITKLDVVLTDDYISKFPLLFLGYIPTAPENTLSMEEAEAMYIEDIDDDDDY